MKHTIIICLLITTLAILPSCQPGENAQNFPEKAEVTSVEEKEAGTEIVLDDTAILTLPKGYELDPYEGAVFRGEKNIIVFSGWASADPENPYPNPDELSKEAAFEKIETLCGSAYFSESEDIAYTRVGDVTYRVRIETENEANDQSNSIKELIKTIDEYKPDSWYCPTCG